MTRHFGVLIPATNTTAEIEYTRHLPPDWQAFFFTTEWVRRLALCQDWKAQ